MTVWALHGQLCRMRTMRRDSIAHDLETLREPTDRDASSDGSEEPADRDAPTEGSEGSFYWSGVSCDSCEPSGRDRAPEDFGEPSD